MRRLELRVPSEQVDAVLDRVLGLLPYGVHEVVEGKTTRLIALGESHQLASADAITALCGDLLVEPPREERAGELREELDRLRPAFRIGDRLLVRPPSSPPPDAASGVVDIVISRSAGFGTGAHPTTRMVLEFLLDMEPEGAFLDIGCGAGAVVVAAAKLGWSPVTGVDFNPLGIEEARANLARNGVEASLGLVDLRTATKLPDARVAVANISEGGIHDRLAAFGWRSLETLVVSGLRLGRDAERAFADYEAAGFVERHRRTARQWVTVRFDHVGV